MKNLEHFGIKLAYLLIFGEIEVLSKVFHADEQNTGTVIITYTNSKLNIRISNF